MRRFVPVGSVAATLGLLAVLLVAGGGSAETVDRDPPVIAYPDTGINPYHEEFRAPNWTEPPSTYIDGYPEDAEPLELTLDADSFEEAWTADRDAWNDVEVGQLYYVPGTRIVGAIALEEPASGLTPIYDDDGHGTMVASVGSGANVGSAPDSAIVVPVLGERWAFEEPWIDLVSSSRGDTIPVGPETAEQRYAFVSGGRSLFQSGGNGYGVNHPGPKRGTPWVVQVGEYLGGDGGAPGSRVCATCHRPVEVLGRVDVPAAEHDSVDGYEDASGTSAAAPRVAGHAAQLVDEARRRLDDVSRPGFANVSVYARADPEIDLPAAGPLSDGDLDRAELEELVRQSADPVPWAMPPEEAAPVVADLVPTDDLHQPAEARYTWQGYGLHDADAFERARSILLGEQPWPDRPVDDRWHDFWETSRGAYWHTALCTREEHRDRYDGDCFTDPARDLARASAALAGARP